LLDKFDYFGVKATFFVLGWFAENHPEVVEKIHERGHEIASHGMTHVPNNRIDNAALEYEIAQSKRALESVTGEEVIGYRATSYSVSPLVLEKLIQYGYKYDSSFFPVKGNGLYGELTYSDIEQFRKKGLEEFSIQTGRFLGMNVPFAGGTYFRVLPLWLIKKQVSHLQSDSLIMYFHPYDFDVRKHNSQNYSLKRLLKSRLGKKRNPKKFVKLLEWFRDSGYKFESMRNLV
jgi:polysaccharide deacetylase family protein (PEP-CTERM system associated)